MEEQIDNNFTYVWIIKNFDMMQKGQYLLSSSFVLNSFPGVIWRMLLLSECHLGTPSIAIFLGREDSIRKDCRVSFSINFLDGNEKEIPGVAISTRNHVFRGHPFEQHLFFRSLSEILIVKCNLKTICESNEEDIFPSLPYQNGLFTDVVLRARDGEFNVHRAMLWARWPELAKKLDEENASEQNFDIGSNILEAMIQFVYTGKADFSGYKFLEELCVTAAKYGLRITSPIMGTIETCQTHINAEKISFIWPIENFSTLDVNTELYRTFNLLIQEYCRFKLRVHIDGKTGTNQTFSIFISKLPEDDFKPTFIKTRVSFDDGNSEENEHLFERDEDWKCAEFSRNFSTNPNDVLLLRCEFKLSDGISSCEVVESSHIFGNSTGNTNLNKSLRNLYETGTLSDVSIVTESRRFSVHKFILCSRSSVFSRMFETEMIELQNSQIEILDVSPDTVHEMLLFLYSGNVDKLCEETALQLYAVADKYDVPALKKMCFSFLKSNITVENVCKILQLTDMHSDDDLYKSALEFFSDHVKEVISTDEWKEWSKNNFCAKLLEHVITRN